MYTVLMTDHEEGYAPPIGNMLAIDVVGDIAFLAIGTMEETFDVIQFTAKEQIAVDWNGLIDALVSASAHDRRDLDRRMP
jgi:hypothetical protein